MSAELAAADPGLERILRLAAPRLEKAGLRAAGRLKLTRITADEVHVVSGLLGGRWRAPMPGADASVDLAAVDAALRGSRFACGLADAAAAALGRPLVDRGAERSAAAATDAAGWTALGEHAALARHPGLRGWLARENATGVARRVAGGPPFVLLASALDAVAVLPADPPVSLARFAAGLRAEVPSAAPSPSGVGAVLDGPAVGAEALPAGLGSDTGAENCGREAVAGRTVGGDPHALDRGTALDGTVRRALAFLDGDDDPAPGVEARRERYDRWGIVCDALSSTVLCAGLRSDGRAPLDVGLCAAADAGEPRVVTLRELAGRDRLAVGPVVFVCENPDVVAAAADELGSSCPPLVCTEGWPSAAALRLLRAVTAAGATTLHHGDMDADGLRIVARLLEVTGGVPWRMTAVDHAAHAADGAQAERSPPEALPDELVDVARAIVATGRVVREEQTIRALLDDLAAHRGADAAG